MNTEKTNETTYFYWELKNNRPTGKLKSKKCTYYQELGKEVYIVPYHENKSLETCNCPIFAVTTNEKDKVVYLSYFFSLFSEIFDISTPYTTILDETEPLFDVTMKFDISKGVTEVSEDEYTFPVNTKFDLIPDQVLKFCFKEIRRLQGIKDIFPLTIKGKEPGNTLYLPFCDIHFHNKKTHFSIEYLKAIIEYPYIPFLYFLRENIDYPLDTKSPLYYEIYLRKFYNINGMDPKSYKEFFKAIKKRPSKFYLRRIFGNPQKFADRLFVKFVKENKGLEKYRTINE